MLDFDGDLNAWLSRMESALPKGSDTSDNEGYGDPAAMETKDYIDARIEATRAQNDARFAEVLASIDKLRDRMETISQHMISRRDLWVAVFTGVATILSVVLAMLAFASDRFDAGVGLSPVVEQIQSQQAARDAQQDEKLDAILEAIGKLQQVRSTPASD